MSDDNLFKIGLGSDEFDLAVGHVVSALESLNVPDDIINDVEEVIGRWRAVVIEGVEKSMLKAQIGPNKENERNVDV